ncbi:MAG: radical SAM protein [Acidobacteriota bacterium]
MARMLALKGSAVYGPVASRRLGASLGINVLPSAGKACTLDCVYCQYGWTRWHRLDELAALDFPSPAAILDQVAGALGRLATPPAYLTFSGNGEPTLHPEFPALVDGIIALRDRLAPSAHTAILSNSSRVPEPSVRAALARLDARIMKLDCGIEATFRSFNRPCAGVTLAGIAAALRDLGGVTIQALFAGGAGGNAGDGEVAAWAALVAGIRPVAVQIYTLDRGWPGRDLEPLPPERLLGIRDVLLRHGLRGEVF